MRGGRLLFAAVAALLFAAALLLARSGQSASAGQHVLLRAIEERAQDRSGGAQEEQNSSRLGGSETDVAEPRARPAGRAPKPDAALRGTAGDVWLPLAAGAFGLGGWPLVFTLQWSLFLLGFLLLAWSLASRLGKDSAALLAAVAWGGSAAGLAVVHLVPEVTAFLALALAGALVWGRRSGPTVEPEQVYGGPLPGEQKRLSYLLIRWPLAGAAFGLVAAGSPAYLPLAAPLLAAAPRERRWGGVLLFLAGGGAAFALVAAASGWPWPPLELWYDPRLLGWNVLFTLVGRHVGVLVAFLPLLLVFVSPAAEDGRRWIPWAVAAALLLQIVLSPFDLGGDSGAPGNPWFLPVFALLLMLPGQPAPRAGVLLVAVAAVLLLAPAWLAAVGQGERTWSRTAAVVLRQLPLETTQRELPGVVHLDHGSGVVLAGIEPEVFRGGGALRMGGRRAAFLLESAAPLASVRLELGAAAPADLAVAGAELGDVVLRPNGELAVDVELGEPARRHPTWRNRTMAEIYRFRIELPRQPAAPIPVDLSLARPLGFAAEPP